uniref:CCHC-type domain-containing protein n=1 Tax=Plectus sambesii TaxID=2011161 RepID=A0A914WI28_9BILA
MEQLVELLRKQLEASEKRADEWAAADSKRAAKRAVNEAKREEKWTSAEVKRHAADLKRAEEYAATTQALLTWIKALATQRLGEGAATLLNTASAQERIMQSLSRTIAEFNPDNDVTFESWYKRLEGTLNVDGLSLDEKSRVRLLVSKLYTTALAKYTKYILPQTPWDIGFDETVKLLTELFKKNNKCFECGVVGHKDGPCVNKEKFRPNVSQIIINGIDTAHDTERNYAKVVIQGVEVKLLADSGSDSTIITHEDWMKMGQPTLTACPDASAVNGSSVRLYGFFHTEFCCTLAPRCGSGMCFISDDIRLMGRGWLNQAIPEHLQALKIICAPVKRKHESENEKKSTIAELQGERPVNKLKRGIPKLRGEGTPAKILQKEPRQGQRGAAMQSQSNRQHGARMHGFAIGDLVYMYDNRAPSKPGWTPGQVIKRTGQDFIVDVDGTSNVCDANKLRHRLGRDDSPSPPPNVRRSSRTEDAHQEPLPVWPRSQSHMKPGRGEASGSMSMEVSRSKPPGACWNCGEEGHINAKCPFKKKRSECGVVGDKDGPCVNKEEIRPKVTLIISGIDAERSGAERSGAERNYAQVVIQGVEVRLLADTGSDSTIITGEDWMKMGQPFLTSCPDASAVNGTTLRLYGGFHTEFCCTLAPRCGSGMCYISDNVRVMGRGWLNQAIPEYLQALMIICHTNQLRPRLEWDDPPPPPDAHRPTTRGARQPPSPPPLRRSTRIRHKPRKLDLDPHKASYRPKSFCLNGGRY